MSVRVVVRTAERLMMPYKEVNVLLILHFVLQDCVVTKTLGIPPCQFQE